MATLAVRLSVFEMERVGSALPLSRKLRREVRW